MSLIILGTDGEMQAFIGGDYTIRTILRGGTATLKFRFPAGDSTFGDFDGGVLTETTKALNLPSCILELTKTGAATVEIDINGNRSPGIFN